VIEKFQMSEAKDLSTPCDCNVILSKCTDQKNAKFPYRQAVGSLMFAATVSRPDISYAVGEVSKYLENPKECHVAAVKRILRYLKATSKYHIKYKAMNEIKFEGFTDADFARDIETRKSTTGYVFLINDSAITWRSHTQKTVALSTTEAECMAACEGVKECLWIRQLLKDVGCCNNFPTTINVDNQGAINLIQNSVLHHNTKHIDIRLKFVREQIQSETCSLKYVNTEFQRADVLTKPLSKARFVKNLDLLGIKQ
jgi:hypothetical protein